MINIENFRKILVVILAVIIWGVIFGVVPQYNQFVPASIDLNGCYYGKYGSIRINNGVIYIKNEYDYLFQSTNKNGLYIIPSHRGLSLNTAKGHLEFDGDARLISYVDEQTGDIALTTNDGAEYRMRRGGCNDDSL